jgi:hypothetical protein
MSNPFTQFTRSATEFRQAPLKDLCPYVPPTFASVFAALPPGAVVAGGSVVHLLALNATGFKPVDLKDIDVFFTAAGKTPELRGPHVVNAIAKFERRLLDARYRYSPKSVLGCTDLLGPKGGVLGDSVVELVKFATFEDAFHLIDGFDIVACQVATDGTTLFHHPCALEDIEQRVINIHRVHVSSQMTVAHVRRYIEKGFTFTGDGVQKLYDEVLRIERAEPQASVSVGAL